MPHLESNHPIIKRQYDAIHEFFYSDAAFFMEEYANLMPISPDELSENPQWLTNGHNSLTVEKFLRINNGIDYFGFILCIFGILAFMCDSKEHILFS